MDQATLAQASSLYFIFPFLAVLYGVTLFLAYKQVTLGRLPAPECILLIGLIVCYLAAYSHLTLSHRTPGDEARIELTLFWSYLDAFRVKNGILTVRRLGLARQILLNILVYLPVGLLMPIAYNGTRHRFFFTAVTGFTLSLLTEILQYLTRRGLCEVDDLLNNTLGCLVGMGLLALGRAVIRRVTERRAA